VEPHAVRVDAVLFDNDGVLVDSGASVDRSWTTWALAHGLDPEPILPVIHGRRAGDLIAELAPHLDIAAAEQHLEDLEVEDAASVAALPGAISLTAAIPNGRWAVVSSGARRLVMARLEAVGISHPLVLVGADDVSRGKPHPDPYRLAADRLGVDPARCLVFEDAPPGVAAGRAAGARVVGVLTRHGADELGADAHVPSLGAVSIRVDHAGLEVRLG
jgi:sugar-phosphatase